MLLIGLFLIIATIVLIIGYFIHVTISKTKESIFTQLKSFYGMSLSNISIALLIAFLVSNIVSSFNIYLMIPLVQSIFPGEDIWQTPVYLPRDKIMYPGLFFQAIIGFILSIGVLFVLYFLFKKLFDLLFSKQPRDVQGRIIEIIIYGFIFFIYIFLLIWNAIELVKSENSISSIQSMAKIPENQESVTIQNLQDEKSQQNQPFIPINQVYLPPNYRG